jgi:hypothetical protein
MLDPVGGDAAHLIFAMGRADVREEAKISVKRKTMWHRRCVISSSPFSFFSTADIRVSCW